MSGDGDVLVGTINSKKNGSGYEQKMFIINVSSTLKKYHVLHDKHHPLKKKKEFIFNFSVLLFV